MSRNALERRRFLTLPLALLLAPLAPLGRLAGVAPAAAEAQRRQVGYDVDVGILHNFMTFALPGTFTEVLDRAAGRYEVAAVGQGSGIANRIESRGIRRGGRWAPLETVASFDVAGRLSRSDVKYDYDRGTIEYHYRGETFLLRRQRIADDLLSMPPGLHVDDAISAVLNYADGLWQQRPDGTYATQLVRRRRPENEGADDVQRYYRAELVPFAMKVAVDDKTGRPAALIDLTGFSSWARQGDPARIVFGADRRPELIVASLILGTSVSIRLKSA